jgi:hypothetical protein
MKKDKFIPSGIVLNNEAKALIKDIEQCKAEHQYEVKIMKEYSDLVFKDGICIKRFKNGLELTIIKADAEILYFDMKLFDTINKKRIGVVHGTLSNGFFAEGDVIDVINRCENYKDYLVDS